MHIFEWKHSERRLCLFFPFPNMGLSCICDFKTSFLGTLIIHLLTFWLFCLEEVTLHLIGQLTNCHLMMQGSFQYPCCLLRAVVSRLFSESRKCVRARTVATGPMILWEPIWQPCGVALLVTGLHASCVLHWAALTQPSPQCPSAPRHIPTEELAKVRLKD